MDLRTTNPGIDASGGETRRALRICLIASLVFHVLLVLSLKNAFVPFQSAEELRTYKVELLRPAVNELDLTENPNADISKPAEPSASEADSEESQETISLDTEDKRYVTYAQAIKEKIAGQWEYPQEARKKKLEGRLLAVFSLNREGALTRISIAEPSGHEVLDREAARAIENSAPFPPFPPTITVHRLNINVSFAYTLTKKN